MIHRVTIQGFKSIADVTVELSPLTVLVGRSGTGKSSFVQALRFLRDILSSQDPGVVKSWTHLRPAMLPDSPTLFDVEFSIHGIDNLFRYELAFSNLGPQAPPLKERLALGAKCLFHQESLAQNRHQAKWIVAPELVHVPDPGPIAIGRVPSLSDVVNAFVALTSGIGCYIFSDRVLDGPPHSRPSSGLDDAATNYLDVLKDIVSNLQDLRVRSSMVETLKRVNPTVSSIELNDFRQPTHVLVGHRLNGKILSLSLSQESDGFRRFYAHMLALYQRPPKQTLIFEHPEDGIHPGALSLLADEFLATPVDGRGQVLLTTHSPRLLDHFAPEQIRVVELDGFNTRIGPISIEQQEAIREHLLDAGELLTADPARGQMEAAGA